MTSNEQPLNKNKTRFYQRPTLGVFLSIALISSIYLVKNKPDIQVIHSVEQAKGPSITSNTNNEPVLAQSNIDAFVDNLIAQLIQHHKRNVHEISIQVRFLDLKKMLIEQFPDQAETLFKRIISSAFPDLAESILTLIEKLEIYQSWYQDNVLVLSQQSHSDRYETIWNKRYSMFGEIADDIWPTEQASDQLQSQREQLQLTLQALNDDNVNSIDEKLFILTTTLSENSDQSAIADLTQQGTISNLFFGLNSVQQDLKSMTPEQRQSTINATRRAMGYSEADIEQLAQEDAVREQRWQNGYAYMSQRNALLSANASSQIDNQLAELRERFFKQEAPTIAAEESAGFYRYERPRYYGRN